MASGVVIRKNQYYDSVYLMRVAKNLTDEAGVEQCAALMATEANKERLTEMGMITPEVLAASPNDLVVALKADDAQRVEDLLGKLDAFLTRDASVEKSSIFHTIEEAAAAFPESNLAVITVPGVYAGREARKALEQGKHVFLFSDNVPVSQEVELKQLAKVRRRLVMGPDCGTSLIGGVGIGFANRVRRGPVGVVGASGTGLQEFTSLIHQAGSGISHAIGTGSHDLSDEVGGITTMMGMDILEADPSTRIIAIISKPSGMRTLDSLAERIRRCQKPVVGCLLGLSKPLDCGPLFRQVNTIDQAVEQALLGSGSTSTAGFLHKAPASSGGRMEQEASRWRPEQRYLRGLFAGGTFCYQAQQVLQSAGIPVFSNASLDPRYRLKNPEESLEHTVLDLGDDYFTEGKPHPMIDSRERNRRILKEANDPEVAILLLDFVLGEIASPDPAGDLLEAIKEAKQSAARGGGITIVASICGTDQDRQDIEQQKRCLLEAGVIILPSSARAAGFCVDLLQQAGKG